MAAKVDQNTDVSPSKPSADEQKMLDQEKDLFAHQAEMNTLETKVKTLGQIMANIAKDAPQ